MYKLCFYVPKPDAERVKQALFAEGAGEKGHYSQWCFESEGITQFMGDEEANPFIGEKNRLEKIVEVKIEMVVEKECVNVVLEALIESHPYEEPSYQIWPVFSLKELAN